MRGQALSKGFGDVTDIECPDPSTPGRYVKVGQFQSGEERATITLEGRMALDLRSELLKLASKRCPVDVQLHFGQCEDLSDFNAWAKSVILEDALLPTYDTEDLGSLTTEDTAPVNESVEVSARIVYDIVTLAFAKKAEDLVTNEVLDVVICDAKSCGGCAGESDGCQKIYAITKAAGGSGGTPPDVVFSLDGGLTWYAHDIDTLTSAQDPTGIACISGYSVVISNAAASHSYVSLSDLDGVTDPAWTEVTTGYAGNGEPNAIWSWGTGAFVVGDWGHIYLLPDPTGGVTILDDSVLTTSDYNAVHGLSKQFAVAVGDSGVIVYTDDGETWQAAPTSPVGVGVNLTAVWVKTKTQWWIGTSTGRVYFTLNGGQTWTEKSFPGSGAGAVWDIAFATDSIGYISHATATPAGQLLQSTDGGYSWHAVPTGGNTLPANDRLTAIAACTADPGLVVGGGLGDNGADGVIITGVM
jgi:photosystem II stability/assembly factor-like uncharacterized protein